MYISESGEIGTTTSPNIAIVKYWGKTNVQEPVNPSISFTLTKCLTETTIVYSLKSEVNASRQFIFEDKRNTGFEQKLIKYLSSVEHILPWLKDFDLTVKSKNNFPHSSGIASSASGFSAIAKGLALINKHVTGEEISITETSNLARLGSGSACRSIEKGWNLWGSNNTIPESNQHYAVNLSDLTNPIFNTICDSVLIVKQKEKKVSSTFGHQLMNNHPYKEGRIKQAFQNTAHLIQVLKNGNVKDFMQIAEEEALSLHGLMLSSQPGYTLLEPNSVTIINKIREYREETNIDIGFTIDAGPNIHVLYFEKDKHTIIEFIHKELLPLCNNQVIHDQIQ